MIQYWKAPHILKGLLTHVPLLRKWRSRHALTGGTDSSQYCYKVWLRHLIRLNEHGFKIAGAHIGELGPGDSIGTGLGALLSGANRYIGLDAIPYSANVNLKEMFSDLVQMFSSRQPIGVDNGFPDDAIDWLDFASKVEDIRREVTEDENCGRLFTYKAPWTSPNVIAEGSLDLIFSEGVLQCIDDLRETYDAMYVWLKVGGYCSHAIGFSAGYLSPYWNGHWAYSDWEWRLVRGRRPFLLSREPLSTHLHFAQQAGFRVLSVTREYYGGGLEVTALTPRFRALDIEDLRTSRATLILRKLH